MHTVFINTTVWFGWLLAEHQCTGFVILKTGFGSMLCDCHFLGNVKKFSVTVALNCACFVIAGQPYPTEITSEPVGKDAYEYIITWKAPINSGLPILSYKFSYRKVIEKNVA